MKNEASISEEEGRLPPSLVDRVIQEERDMMEEILSDLTNPQKKERNYSLLVDEKDQRVRVINKRGDEVLDADAGAFLKFFDEQHVFDAGGLENMDEKLREKSILATDIFAKLKKGTYKPIIKGGGMVHVVDKKSGSTVLETDLKDFLEMAKLSHAVGRSAWRLKRDTRKGSDA